MIKCAIGYFLILCIFPVHAESTYVSLSSVNEVAATDQAVKRHGLIAFNKVSQIKIAPLRIGVAAPLSGAFKPIGMQIRDGARMAARDFSIGDHKIEIIVVDDQCEREDAKVAANMLVDAKVNAVIGHVCWGASSVGSVIYNKAGIIQISPATRNQQFLTERPDPQGGVYALSPLDRGEAQQGALFLKKHFPQSRIALFNDDSDYGKKLTNDIKRSLTLYGLSPVLSLDFKTAKVDYKVLAQQLQSEMIDVVFVAGYYADIALLARAMREQGVETSIIGGEALLSHEYGKLAGQAARKTFAIGLKTAMDFPTAYDIQNALREHDIEPELYVLIAYAAVEILVRAADQSMITGKTLKEQLNQDRFKTVLGMIAFNRDGSSNIDFWKAYEWRDETFLSLPEAIKSERKLNQ